MKILDMMDANNGEARLKAARYETGWYCVCTLTDTQSTDQVWEWFEDLVGGDIDFEYSRECLEDQRNQCDIGFSFTRGKTPFETLKTALEALEASYG